MDIRIDKKSLFNALGYKNDIEPSTRIASLLDEYVSKAQQLIDPSYSFLIKDIKEVNGYRVYIENAVVFESEAISRLLNKCEEVAVFILTIGNGLEETLASLADNNKIIEAYVLDTIGSSIVEKLADYVQGMIEEEARTKDLCISRRFSPGQCDWDISQQKMIFNAMKGCSSGVDLTDEYLMVPQKSLSGIIGIGSCDNGVREYNPCQICDKANCLWRRCTIKYFK